MSTQDILLSQKFNNYNYAPGIATYGIDGKTGRVGTDGNNIYFTDCNLLTDTDKDLKILAELIANNYLPVKGSTTRINRSYKNNDLFFDYNGIIYQLTNIDDLIGNKDIGGIYSDYFNIAGKINIADTSNLFTWVGDRMVLNSSTYSGYDVVIINNPSNATNYINKDAVVNIISDNVNENSNIEMIKLQSIDDVDIEDGKLSVYYKTTENAFYLDSNKPIVINGDVKLNTKNNTNNEYDNFSTVLTSTDTITYFKHICDKLRYNVLYDSEVNQYKLIIYQKDGGRNDLEYLVNRNETVYGKVYTGENDQVLVQIPNTIIDSSLNINDYTDFGIGEKFQYGQKKETFYTYEQITYSPKYTVEANEIFVDMNYNTNSNQLTIDVSLDIYPDIIGDFTLTTKQNQGENKYIAEAFNNDDGIYKFTFSPKNTIENIDLCLQPNTIFKCGTNSFTQPPIICPIIFENTDSKNKQYTMYFKLEYSNDPSALSIKDIMIFNRDDLLNRIDSSLPHIETCLPDSVESVQRFSLLHNTEVFINFQE